MSRNNQSRSQALSVLLIAILLMPLALVGSCQAQSPDSKQEATEAVAQVRQDLSLLETLNRLSLSPQQAEKLLEIASNAQKATAAFEAVRQRTAARLLPLLEKQFTFMLQDQQVPGELLQQISEVELELQQIDEQSAGAPLAFAAEARKVLTDPQILIITGGDEARRAAEEMLIWVRELSAEDFNSEARANAEALAKPDLGLDADAVYDTFVKTRSLAPEDYARQVEQLAEKLAPLYRSDAAGEDVQITGLLVNQRFISVLRQRMQYLAVGGGQG